MVALRRLFVETMPEEDVARFVFVDETSTTLTYGRAPTGRRLGQAVAAAAGQVGVRLIDEFKTGNVFFMKVFCKQAA